MEDRYHPALERMAQVDHDVTTTQQVDSRKRRVTEYILRREDAEISDCFAYLVSAVNPMEEPAKPHWRNVCLYRFLVETRPRPLHGLLAQVGPKDLNRNFRTFLSQELNQ